QRWANRAGTWALLSIFTTYAFHLGFLVPGDACGCGAVLAGCHMSIVLREVQVVHLSNCARAQNIPRSGYLLFTEYQSNTAASAQAVRGCGHYSHPCPGGSRDRWQRS